MENLSPGQRVDGPKARSATGDTVLELAAGLGDTGFVAARLVGETGCVIITDFTSEMVAAARWRAEEVGVENAEFRMLDAERMDLVHLQTGR